MTFSVHPVGPDPDTELQLFPSVSPPGASPGKSFVPGKGNQMHLRKLLQNPRNRLLVLAGCKRTGGIQQLASRPQHLHRLTDDLSLLPGKILRLFGRPVLCHSLLLPEHSLAGTWGVHKNLIEKSLENSGQRRRRLVCHKRIIDSETSRL